MVRHGEHTLGGILETLTDFCSSMGWTVSRPPDGQGLDDLTLLQVAAELGLTTAIGSRCVLSEALFVSLQEEPESREVYEQLLPLERSLSAWLEAREARAG